jgi:SAM-dependent methyltransferase
VTASDWSRVDAADDPLRFLSGLDTLRAEPFFADSKARMAAHLAASGSTRVLDVGCGTGEDAAELTANAIFAIGIERSITMGAEARRRAPALTLTAADAQALPFRDGTTDAVRADRVIQHLPDAPAALREWHRVLSPGGRLLCFDPDLTSASVDGVDQHDAATVLAWRHGTRPGAETVHQLADALGAAGFGAVNVEPLTLDLTDLNRADGIMGLAAWGHNAAAAGELSRPAADRWHHNVHAAAANGTLRYRCTYLLGTASR